MRWQPPAALAVTLLIAWAGIDWAMNRRPTEMPRPVPRPRLSLTHYATPRQLTASGSRSGGALGSVTALAHDGKRRGWDELAGRRPMVLVFIKEGCPCSVEFEPFFHRLYRAYGGSAGFAGVIDGGVDAARRYAEDNRVPYVVLADSEQEFRSRFGVENSAYVALVAPGGVVDTLWPGCSAEMMRELGRRIAALAEVDEQPIETAGLPGAITAGCPFGG